MTDPAKPAEATPETERVATLRELIAEIKQPLWRLAANARLDEYERAITLAQTENAGHIRIEDELKAALREVRALMQPGQIDAVMEGIRRRDEQLVQARAELKIQDDANDILQRRFDEAQAQCAELEKLLAEVIEDRYEANYSLGTALVDRIDAALKPLRIPE